MITREQLLTNISYQKDISSRFSEVLGLNHFRILSQIEKAVKASDTIPLEYTFSKNYSEGTLKLVFSSLNLKIQEVKGCVVTIK